MWRTLSSMELTRGLSAGTVSRKHPVKVLEATSPECIGAEAHLHLRPDRFQRRSGGHFERTDEAMATTWTAYQMHAKAIISLTESGSSAQMTSRAETEIPIYALTPQRRMTLCRDVHPIAFIPSRLDTPAPVRESVSCSVKRGVLATGDRVLITKGGFTGPGDTNAMNIVVVRDLPPD